MLVLNDQDFNLKKVYIFLFCIESSMVSHQSCVSEKIALFRALFRGREDVYPRRFESKKTDKSGYSPACANEWIRGICEKPKIKCSACQHRRLIPITNDIVRWHLSGKDDVGKDFIMGIYPMLLDETCFFLVADFDKSSWVEDASTFLKTCQQLNIAASLERSRSGKGAHVWIFFAEPMPASLARKMGCHILTETMELRPDIGMDSYDRFFPNQDTLPQGGFGNLIALPLQKKARDLGNSVFVDENMTPYKDQWAFLSRLRKMTKREVETIVHSAAMKGRIIGAHLQITDEDFAVPWQRSSNIRISPSEPMPSHLEIVVSNEIYIPKDGIPPSLKNRLVRLATFQNPEFYKAQAMRLPTHEKSRLISCASDHPQFIGLPRGCLEEVVQLLTDLNVQLTIRDELESKVSLSIKFLGELRSEQKAAATAMLKTNFGVLSATTAFGKTVLAAWLIAQRKTNTLVLVHRKQLQEQWILRLSTFLELKKGTIGRVGGGKKQPTGLLDVAIIQSLVRKGVVDEIVGKYGHIIVDECHHLPAFSFEQVARQAKAKFITGLSATVARKDGHHPIIFMRCGPIRYRVDAKAQAELRPFEHTVFVRPTSFSPTKPASEEARLQFSGLYAELVQDKERNSFICSEIIQAVKRGRSPIVLTERNDHLDYLLDFFRNSLNQLQVVNPCD